MPVNFTKKLVERENLFSQDITNNATVEFVAIIVGYNVFQLETSPLL